MVNKHGTATKIVGTAIFGLVGLAATSGVKNETSMEKVLTKLEVGKEELILKNFRIPFSIINSIEEMDDMIVIRYGDTYEIHFWMILDDYGLMWLLIEELNKIVEGTSKIDYCNSISNSNNQLEQLEKLGELRDKGIITEEEFLELKNNII